MPIYVFVCKGCDNQFEKIVWGTTEETACPLCGQEATRGIEVPSPFVWGRGGAFNG